MPDNPKDYQTMKTKTAKTANTKPVAMIVAERDLIQEALDAINHAWDLDQTAKTKVTATSNAYDDARDEQRTGRIAIYQDLAKLASVSNLDAETCAKAAERFVTNKSNEYTERTVRAFVNECKTAMHPNVRDRFDDMVAFTEEVFNHEGAPDLLKSAGLPARRQQFLMKELANATKKMPGIDFCDASDYLRDVKADADADDDLKKAKAYKLVKRARELLDEAIEVSPKGNASVSDAIRSLKDITAKSFASLPKNKTEDVPPAPKTNTKKLAPTSSAPAPAPTPKEETTTSELDDLISGILSNPNLSPAQMKMHVNMITRNHKK